MRWASFYIADLLNLLLGALYESDEPKMRICAEDILLIQDNSKLSHLMTHSRAGTTQNSTLDFLTVAFCQINPSTWKSKAEFCLPPLKSI